MELSDNLKPIVGGILAALAALSVALVNNGDVTGGELGLIIGAFVAGTGLVAATPDSETLAAMRLTRENRATRRAAGRD